MPHAREQRRRRDDCTHDAGTIDARVRVDVEKFGWHALHVHDEGDPVHWTYTIGFEETFGHPEFVVFGIPAERAHEVLADLAADVMHGQTFEAGGTYRIFADRDGKIFDVDPAWHETFLGTADRFYGARGFRALQCVWPDLDGNYPWDKRYSDTMPSQPLLAAAEERDALGMPAPRY